MVIAGPTASGKSSLALEVAQRFGGTVINADSMQVYRDLAILTARPDAEALARAPHALYGVLDGAELCSAAAWADMARAAIRDSDAVGRLPILCGGSGLYLRTLLDGIAPVPEIPASIRAEARALHAALGGPALRAALALRDPEAAARLHESDTQRLIRAYEVVLATGRPLGDWQREAAAGPGALTARSFILLPPRDALNRAIDRRFAAMVAAGALDEVRALTGRRLDPALPVMKALGVPALAAHLRGEIPLDRAVEQAQTASRQYAKRQSTWFRRQLSAEMTLCAPFSAENAGLICRKLCEEP